MRQAIEDLLLVEDVVPCISRFGNDLFDHARYAIAGYSICCETDQENDQDVEAKSEFLGSCGVRSDLLKKILGPVANVRLFHDGMNKQLQN